MTRPRTVMTLVTFNADGSTTEERYQYDAEFTDRANLLFWLRDQGMDFWTKMKAGSLIKQEEK